MAVSALQTLQIAQIARRTNQQAQVGALIRKNARNVGSQKSGRACNESFQQ